MKGECDLVFSIVLSVCIMSSNLKNEDTAKSCCICDFYTFFKTRVCERHFIFMNRVPASTKVGNPCLRQLIFNFAAH